VVKYVGKRYVDHVLCVIGFTDITIAGGGAGTEVGAMLFSLSVQFHHNTSESVRLCVDRDKSTTAVIVTRHSTLVCCNQPSTLLLRCRVLPTAH
jgi:hypothetical protein